MESQNMASQVAYGNPKGQVPGKPGDASETVQGLSHCVSTTVIVGIVIVIVS